MATEAIHKTVEELGNKPEEANQLVTFLNNKNRYQLVELQIEDWTTIIIEIKKVDVDVPAGVPFTSKAIAGGSVGANATTKVEGTAMETVGIIA